MISLACNSVEYLRARSSALTKPDCNSRVGVAITGHQVETRVGLALPFGPVDPAPHRVVLLGDRRVQLEVAHHQLLERGSPLGVRRRCSKRLDHLVHRSHARRPYCPTRTSTGRIGPPVAAIRLACWARMAN